MAEFLGVDVTYVDGVGKQKFPLGTRYRDDRTGKEYMYVKAGGTIAAAKNCTIAAGFVSSALAGVGIVGGISGVAAVINEFFWLQIAGMYTAANVATAFAANAVLGRVSDANGDFTVAAATTGGRGHSFTAESGGLADVLLYSL